MTQYKMAEVRGALTKEVLDVVRRIISRAEGASLITDEGNGGRRLVWSGFARATWDCSSVWALEAPGGMILASLPPSKKVEWVFRDQDGEEAWLVGTAELRVVEKVDLRASNVPVTLVTKVEWTGVEIGSHGISICVHVAKPETAGGTGGISLSSGSKR
jgi:hypothetical protein